MKNLIAALLVLLAVGTAHAQLPPTNTNGLDLAANNAQTVSAAGHLRLRYNTGTGVLEQSIAGAAYVSVAGTTTLQGAYNGGNTVTVVSGTPIALTLNNVAATNATPILQFINTTAATNTVDQYTGTLEASGAIWVAGAVNASVAFRERQQGTAFSDGTNANPAWSYFYKDPVSLTDVLGFSTMYVSQPTARISMTTPLTILSLATTGSRVDLDGTALFPSTAKDLGKTASPFGSLYFNGSILPTVDNASPIGSTSLRISQVNSIKYNSGTTAPTYTSGVADTSNVVAMIFDTTNALTSAPVSVSWRQGGVQQMLFQYTGNGAPKLGVATNSGALGFGVGEVDLYSNMGGTAVVTVISGRFYPAFSTNGTISNGWPTAIWSDVDTNLLTIPQLVTNGGTPHIFNITGGAHTALTNAEDIDLLVNLTRTVTFLGSATPGAANITTQRAVSISAPTYAFGPTAAQVITNAATFAITGAPAASTNATITNTYALWVQAGLSRLARLSEGSGTALVAGDFAVAAGWGSTASIGSLSGSDGNWVGTVTTAGITLAANPTLVLTYKDLTWGTAPVCVVEMSTTSDATNLATKITWTTTATALTITFNGTPLVTNTYVFNAHCMGVN